MSGQDKERTLEPQLRLIVTTTEERKRYRLEELKKIAIYIKRRDLADLEQQAARLAEARRQLKMQQLFPQTQN